MLEIQEKVKKLYNQRNYTSDLLTLVLGLCEEAGEVAKAANTFHNPNYKPSSHNNSDTLEHELLDLLIYSFGIANVMGIDIEKSISLKLDKKLEAISY